MIQNTTTLDKQVCQIYEPRYGRQLSDEEVSEIKTNLKAFAQGISEIAKRLYGFANTSLSGTSFVIANP